MYAHRTSLMYAQAYFKMLTGTRCVQSASKIHLVRNEMSSASCVETYLRMFSLSLGWSHLKHISGHGSPHIPWQSYL